MELHPPPPAVKPLIDRSRPSYSRPHSPSPSPSGSPLLRSVLKHPHNSHPSDLLLPASAFKLDDAEVDEHRSAASSVAGSIYSRRVGFDTFESGVDLVESGSTTGGGTGLNYSFTLSAKSVDYARTKQTRTFLVGTDLNVYSIHALSWLLSSLIEDGDEVIILRVVVPGAGGKDLKSAMGEGREQAEEVLERAMREAGEKTKISLVVEFVIGGIEETIHRMIEIYKPDSLVVGTKGRTDSFLNSFMGSISKYAVARSPVPVVVVRPVDKVQESLSRRLSEPKKRDYLNLINDQSSLSSEGSVIGRSLTAPANVAIHIAAGEGALERTQSAGGQEKDGEGGERGRQERKGVKKLLEFKRFGTVG